MIKKIDGFELEIEEGSFSESQIIVLLGENGTGKTTFVKILAGIDQTVDSGLSLKISYKPQTISPKFEGTVQDLLYQKIEGIWKTNEVFKQTVYDALNIEHLLQNEVQDLSGGEMQRVGICVALGKKADLYLIDEPSAYLDVEQRINTAKGIKKFIMMFAKTAFVVEHDFIMANYLADKFIVYEGQPGVKCKANRPMSIVEGMNKFLSQLGVTFRRDSQNLRPRINKIDSTLDKEQKLSGQYYFVDS